MQPSTFRTGSIEAASAIMAREWSRHHLGADRRDFHMRFRHRLIGAHVSIGRLAYGTDVRITPVERDHVLLVQMPLRGSSTATFAGSSVRYDRHSLGFIDVRSLNDEQFSADFSMLVLRVRFARLVQHLEALLGVAVRRPLEFEPQVQAGSTAWLGWMPVASALKALDANPHGVSEGFLAGLEFMVLSALLNEQRHTYSAKIAASNAQVAPRHVRKAEEYVRAHAGEAITTATLAAQVGVSVRALYDGFTAFRGVTPADYLRSFRLDRARADLLAGNDLIEEIARRWGFAHPGHFAACYQKRFGEAPARKRRYGRP